MIIQIQPWEIQEYLDAQTDFNLNPKYQRLPVWKGARKPLLIDSILRGYDLPKFYVNIISNNPNKYEVTDGQQRLRTIVEFYQDKFSLEPNTVVDNVDISRLKYSSLPQPIKDKFLSFTLSFSEILTSEVGEVNELFIRLQKGVELNPVELRHAMFSNFGFAVDELLSDGDVVAFFEAAKIPTSRYKHQDYLDHVIAISILEATRDLKAEAMYDLYRDNASLPATPFNRHFRNVKKVLKKMTEMTNAEPGIFKNKWSMVDAFWLLLDNIANLPRIDSTAFAVLYKEFNAKRLEYRKQPEVALRSRSLGYGRELYNYINAFEKEAANKASLISRKASLDAIFEEILQPKFN